MDICERLRHLERNLYWTWHPDVVHVFRDIDPELWRAVNHNPVDFLDHVSEEVVAGKASALALRERITRVFHQLRDYLEDDNTWGACHTGPMHSWPVAYFCAEFGLHESLPIYSGGLGVLAGDHLKSASDLGVPLVGVGLLYAKGYFAQSLNGDGWQQENYLVADIRKLPLERVTNRQGEPLLVRVESRESQVHVGIWTAAVGRNRLVLLDTNVEPNNDGDRALTSTLYGGDVHTRIRQELVLGVGGMRALTAMGIQPGIIHLNEGHSAFAVLERARMMMERDGRPFGEIREPAALQCVFTTHTPVEAGHDRFDAGLVERTVGPLREQMGLSERDLLALGRVNPDDPNEPFCMTVLGLRMSRWRNAVSSLHGRVTRAMWHGLWPGRGEDEVPIFHVTNGVHVASWISESMADLYARCLGTDWLGRIHDPQIWSRVECIDEVEFWEQHQILKSHLIDFVRRRVHAQELHRGQRPADSPLPHCLDSGVLTVGFARRLAGYKRSNLLFRDLDRLDRMVNHPDRPVQFIFSGKAHPGNHDGKQRIQQLYRASQDPRFHGRIVFIEDYDINVARHLVQGVDVWLNTPRRPREACGTSGQKVVLNGGLNLSVLDGWWAEAYDGENGFAIGAGGEHREEERQDARDAETLYHTLEDVVAPLFYDRDDGGVPRGWVRRQLHALRTLPWKFSARRMVMDYTLRCYLPAIGAITCSFPADP